MARVTMLLAALLIIGVLVVSVTPASAAVSGRARAIAPQVIAQGEYPNVSGLCPFSAAANYMSLPGYLRWQTFKDQSVWLTYAEARRIVLSQMRGIA